LNFSFNLLLIFYYLFKYNSILVNSLIILITFKFTKFLKINQFKIIFLIIKFQIYLIILHMINSNFSIFHLLLINFNLFTYKFFTFFTIYCFAITNLISTVK